MNNINITAIKNSFIKLKPYRDVLYLIVITVLCVLWVNQCKRTISTENAIINLNDSITTVTHPNGSTTSTTGAITVDKNTLKKIKTSDPSIKVLQKTVDNSTISATVIGTDTKVTGVYKDSSTVSTPWVKGYINRINSDSIKLDLNIINDYIVSIKEKGIINRKVEVEILTINPFTQVRSLKTYVKPLKKYKIIIGPQIGYGVGFNPSTLTLSTSYYIGLGVTFPIIKI